METQRKPYYVLRPYSSKMVLHAGIGKEAYSHNGNVIQLYLTDGEIHKYDNKKVCKVLEQYTETIKSRCMYMPSELILYAISEVLYESEEESIE